MTKEEVANHLTNDNPTIRKLAEEIRRLHEAIRIHQEKTGHALCWLNDIELWRAVDSEPRYPHETLPIREEFLKQCGRFYESRVKGTPYEEPAPDKKVGAVSAS